MQTYKVMDVILEEEEPQREKINASILTQSSRHVKNTKLKSFIDNKDEIFPIMNNKMLNFYSF
jgi:hypothetical protein